MRILLTNATVLAYCPTMSGNGQIAAEIGRLRREVRELTARERRLAAAKKRKRKSKPRDLIKVLEVAEVRKAIEAAHGDGPLAHALVATGYHFGLRAGEYGKIRREHVHLDGDGGGEVYVTAEKDSVSQTQPIDRRLVDLAPILRAWLAAAPDSPWLFPSPRDPSRGLARGAINRIIGRVWTAAGLPRRAAYPHILKASVASHLIGVGASVQFVQYWLRHKSAGSTQAYIKLTADARRQGTDAMARLGEALWGENHAAG